MSSEENNVQQIEQDLKEFYQFCKENKLTEREIAQICKPLSERIHKFSTFRTIFIKVAIILLIVYGLSYFEFFSWIYSAIGRLFLIELLPYWNWPVLKTEKCLVPAPPRPVAEAKTNPNPNPNQLKLNQLNCHFCEHIKTIDVVDAFEIDMIYKYYIKLNRPVVLENGLDNWEIPGLNSTIFDRIISDKIIGKSLPCKFASNLYYKPGTLKESLHDYKSHKIYFIHFQNCQFDAVKSLRKYIPRPAFLSPEIYPIQYSWIVKSKNYKVEKYKELFFDDPIVIVGQLEGDVELMLHPEGCDSDCATLRVHLIKGEALVFTTYWSYAYLPGWNGESMQVILEAH